jgi:hypothetical protein
MALLARQSSSLNFKPKVFTTRILVPSTIHRIAYVNFELFGRYFWPLPMGARTLALKWKLKNQLAAIGTFERYANCHPLPAVSGTPLWFPSKCHSKSTPSMLTVPCNRRFGRTVPILRRSGHNARVSFPPIFC